MTAAKKADRELRANEKKLRFRHNIQRVIAKWAAAKKAATGEAKRDAAEGEASAWALLAHWSGRGDDARKAAELKAALAERPKPEALAEKKKFWLAKVDVEQSDERVALSFDLDEAPKIRRGVVDNVKDGLVRVYFDLTPAVASKAATEQLTIAAPEIRSARVAQFDADTARLVVDVEAAHADRVVAHGAQVVFERPVVVAKKTEEPEAKEPEVKEPEAEDDPRAELKRLETALRELTDDEDDVLEQIVADMRETYPDVEPKADEAPKVAKKAYEAPAKEAVVAKVEAPAKKDVTPPPTDLKRSTRLAARPRASSLLAVRRIVIDPGHGGKDHGAIGPGRVREKNVNLAISKRLAKSLTKRLGVEVVLTRSTDKFISLKRRSQIANRSGADLFISIHANANRNKGVHGIETYHLNVTSNRYAKRLARRENMLERGAGDVPEPEPQEEEPIEELIPDGKAGQDLRLILADLAMRSATIESRRLAGYVQSSLVGRLRRNHDDVRDLGVKHALFYVLLGARMPAVLIETGFVSSPMESKRLSSSKYQSQVADAIASGVERFILERQRLAQGGVASL
ncbi:MAG: N-acetylmuramoyl-L-alanine amidase [Deltaproteobacteria bacterium]